MSPPPGDDRGDMAEAVFYEVVRHAAERAAGMRERRALRGELALTERRISLLQELLALEDEKP